MFMKHYVIICASRENIHKTLHNVLDVNTRSTNLVMDKYMKFHVCQPPLKGFYQYLKDHCSYIHNCAERSFVTETPFCFCTS